MTENSPDLRVEDEFHMSRCIASLVASNGFYTAVLGAEPKEMQR
jgi:hypothetical protein